MSSFLREAFKGAKADIDSAGHELWPRLARTARVAGILGMELAAIVALAPYGAYAMSVYRRLPAIPASDASSASDSGGSHVAETQDQHQPLPQPPSAPPDLAPAIRLVPPGRDGVAIQRQVPYGPAPRNTLDIYVPLRPPPSSTSPSAGPRSDPSSQRQTVDSRTQSQPSQQYDPVHQQRPEGQGQEGQGQGELLPVVFFVHGGVWASGETWQYAPLATRLAQAGLVVVVPTYTLYPEALMGTMVEEVSAALTWTFDNVRRYGGDTSRITVAGHSAGGHLVAWVLLRRAAAAQMAADAAAAAAAAAAGVSWPTASQEPLSAGALMGAAAAAVGTAVSRSGKGNGGGHEDVIHMSVEEAEAEALEREREWELERRRRWEREGRERLEAWDEQQTQGSAAQESNRRDTAAYLLGGGGTSLPGALHALRAVADVQLHPRPGVDVSYDGDDGAAAAAAAAAARPTHAEIDTRMPHLFVGMSSVYDIAKHYEFEKNRAVHELSMMKRAAGGPAGFAAASPTVILAAAADAASACTTPSTPSTSSVPSSATSSGLRASYFTSFQLLGDAIPARAGLTDPEEAAALAAAGPTLQGQGYAGLPEAVVAGGGSGGAGGTVVPEQPPPEARFSLAAAARLPPFVVMGSCSDHMVPWHEGAELVAQLKRCGVPVRHLLYNHVGHGDYVMAWRPLDLRDRPAPPASPLEEPAGHEQRQQQYHLTRGAEAPGRDLRGLLPCAKDFLRIALGVVDPVPGAVRQGAAAGYTTGTGTRVDGGDGGAEACAGFVGVGVPATTPVRSRL